MKKRIGKNDLILIGVLLTIALLIFVIGNYVYGKAGAKVVITIDGEIYGTYSLEEEQTIAIKKKDKTTNILQIKDGQASMITADCPDQLCVHQNAITKEGQTIVCLPNRVVVEIEGDAEKQELDAIAR